MYLIIFSNERGSGWVLVVGSGGLFMVAGALKRI